MGNLISDLSREKYLKKIQEEKRHLMQMLSQSEAKDGIMQGE